MNTVGFGSSEMNAKLDVVVPCIPRDFHLLMENLPAFRRYLPMKRMVVVGPLALKPSVDRLNVRDVVFLNEADLVDHSGILENLKRRNASKTAGWLIQQFVKLAYCYVAEDVRYLVWDADTTPCRPYRYLSADGRTCFDMKTEFHELYFDTIGKLFKGMGKTAQGSFISEHMCFETALVKEMLEELGGRWRFEQNVLTSVDDRDLTGGCFSEFETYGTWCVNRHPGRYELRKWRSFRFAAHFVRRLHVVVPLFLFRWVGYDAVSLEHRHFEFVATVCQWIASLLCTCEAGRRLYAAHRAARDLRHGK